MGKPDADLKVDGLTAKEAERRLKKYGPNEIKELFHVSPMRILIHQVENNFVIYLLSIAAIISFLVDDAITGYVIIAILVIIVFAGFIQEYRAERAIKALKLLVTPTSVVLREGKSFEIPSSKLVPGDIILLHGGDKVPADAVLINAIDLRVNESVLTGEPSEKRKLPIKDDKSGSKENTVFMGTFIVSGKCNCNKWSIKYHVIPNKLARHKFIILRGYKYQAMEHRIFFLCANSGS